MCMKLISVPAFLLIFAAAMDPREVCVAWEWRAYGYEMDLVLAAREITGTLVMRDMVDREEFARDREEAASFFFDGSSKETLQDSGNSPTNTP